LISISNASDPTEGQSVGKLRAAAEQALAEGNADKALELFNRVVQMEPANGSNYYKRFRVYLRQMKFKEAVSDLSKVLEISSSDENALGQRAKLQLRIGRCSEALQDFHALRKINPAHKDLGSQEQAERCDITMKQVNKM
jgi:tetratricopeptide (TPR) repeat protein